MSDKKLPKLVDLHENVFFDEEKGEVVILDRRKLPDKLTYYRGRSYEEVARGIEKMVTQSLGVSPAAGYGVAIAAYNARNESDSTKKKTIRQAVKRMKNTRPTQTSLHHLVDEMEKIALKTIKKGDDLFVAMRNKAYDWTAGLMETSRKLGRYASQRIEDGDTILTHCYGGPAIYFMGDFARDKGKNVNYYCTETRPYLQGARLTSLALSEGDFKVTLITDGMPAYCMNEGLIDKFITGADRIAMDGGVANKIGTYQIALAAKEHRIPFYAISYTGPDPNTETYRDVEVEIRNPEEVKKARGKRTAPKEVNAYYPAFDCTPPKIVEGVVTDKGIYSPKDVHRYIED
ncbi:MAG: s-methyl-5-thioribose-1-phosphate isomerase [Candidatus Hadarchaeota archaeon]